MHRLRAISMQTPEALAPTMSTRRIQKNCGLAFAATTLTSIVVAHTSAWATMSHPKAWPIARV
jgi:hypothetical protein